MRLTQFSHLKSQTTPKYVPVIAAVLLVAIIGSVLMNGSHALTQSVAIEPENGVASGTASIQSDTAASNGKAILFSAGTGQSTCPDLAAGRCRPYAANGPWNSPIAAAVAINPNSATFMQRIATKGGVPLTSDPDQYTIPVYLYNASTPKATVKMSGYFSSYDNGDSSRVGYGFEATITNVPIPAGVAAGVGSDGQITFWDPVTGTEYAFWQFGKDASGNYFATNGFRYHTTGTYNGRFADGLAGRGAGTPYFAGLVRKWEIDQGRIDHALAFAYKGPSPEFVYPASKSDGGNFGGISGVDVPEGTRIQLNPALTDADLTAYGLNTPSKVIAKALQKYGMYVIDNSGSSKIYLEGRTTAGWGSDITRSMLSNVPWFEFRVVAPPVVSP